jgi:hypothetical protein
MNLEEAISGVYSLDFSAVHAPGCSPLKCNEAYGVADATFVCTQCGEVVGWCKSAIDNVQVCDECTVPCSAPALAPGWTEARLIAVIRTVHLMRLGVVAIGDFESWTQAETLDVELSRSVFATVEGETP